MKKWFALLPFLIIFISGCAQEGFETPACISKESVVDQIILDGLESSDYITNLAEKGFELQRFGGPTYSCSDIPDNYVHLNFWYTKGDFLYRLTIQTECDPLTLTCTFNSIDFFEQINYLESMEFISSRIESGYYKECEVHWLFDQKDRVRYHQQKLVPSEDDLDIYLVSNNIVKALEGNIDRCADKRFTCKNE